MSSKELLYLTLMPFEDLKSVSNYMHGHNFIGSTHCKPKFKHYVQISHNLRCDLFYPKTSNFFDSKCNYFNCNKLDPKTIKVASKDKASGHTYSILLMTQSLKLKNKRLPFNIGF